MIESLEETKKEWDRMHKRSDDVSAKLGEMMLSGWTLLGSLCPGIDNNHITTIIINISNHIYL